MLLERAFVLSVSARATLAVAALALSVAFALVAAGAVSGIDASGASYDEARANPGHVVFEEGFASFPAATVPANAVRVDWYETANGSKVATVDPWPRDGVWAVLGPYAGAAEEDHAVRNGFVAERHTLDHAPLDALVLAPENYSVLAPERADQARLAFVPGANAPSPDAVPWRGVALYFEAGAAQIVEGLAALVLVTGAVATLLSSGLIYLEVAARSRDLATLNAIAGPRVVRRLIVRRTLVLVAGGLIVGTVAAFAILRLARTAIAGLSGEIPPVYLIGTWLVVGVGATTAGILAGLRAGRRATLRSTGGAAVAVRRFPGPLAFLVVTPRLFAGVVAASAVTVAILGVVVGTTQVPDRIFSGAEENEVYIAEGTGNPLRGTVDLFLATNAHRLDEVEAALPETYAPSVWRGHPLMVKGTDFALWNDYVKPDIVAGRQPAGPGEATIGVVKARVADIQVGDVLTLPSSYRIGVERVEVVGKHETGGIEDDQLYVDLETAGRLAGLPADKATGMRARLVPETAWNDVATSGIQITQLRVSPSRPVPLTPAVATFTATNFDPLPQTRTAALRVNGAVEDIIDIEIEGHATRTFQVPFTVPPAARLVLEVNPTTEVQTARGALVLTTPDVARPGEPFDVAVHDDEGDPVREANVLVNGFQRTVTAADGRATLTIDDPSLVTVSVETPRGSGGALVRVAPVAWDDAPHLATERLDVGDPSTGDTGSFRVDVHVIVANLGGRVFNGTIDFTVDGVTQANTSAALGPGERAPFDAAVQVPYPRGTLMVLDRSEVVAATDPGEPGGAPSGPSDGGDPARPRTVEDVLAEKRAAAQAARVVGSDRTASFLSQVFAQVQDASLVIVLVTIAHGGTLVWVSVLREIRERESIVRLLRDLGADAEQVRRRAVRDVLAASIPAVAVGLIGAHLGLQWAAAFGFPAAFGHTLPVGGWGLFVRTGLALVGIAVLAAIYGVHMVGPRQAHAARATPLPALVGGETA